jgi:hypothetical protein
MLRTACPVGLALPTWAKASLVNLALFGAAFILSASPALLLADCELGERSRETLREIHPGVSMCFTSMSADYGRSDRGKPEGALRKNT